jgi:hypothetical protein
MILKKISNFLFRDPKKKVLNDYINFTRTHTVDIRYKNEFNTKDCFFRIKKFYSDEDELVKINNEYRDRFNRSLLIIADADNGDYLLINDRGNILFWNHEINDFGYDSNAEKPTVVAKDIMQFLSNLTESSDLDIDPDVKSINLSNDFKDLFKDYLK